MEEGSRGADAALEPAESARPREEDDHPATQVFARNDSPVARVRRSVAVVAEHEVRSFRHLVGTEMIARSIWLRKRRTRRVDCRIEMDGVRLTNRFAIHEQLF